MGDTKTWRASATYVGALAHSIQKLGHAELVRSRMDAASLEMFDAPNRQAWWPGRCVASVLNTLHEARGPALVRDVSIDLSREQMGPLGRPLASVVLLFAKSPPVALFSRLQTFLSSGIHGVEVCFAPKHDGGSVAFIFPEPVPTSIAEAWHGVFDVAFSLARAGRVVGQDIGSTVHRFELQW